MVRLYITGTAEVKDGIGYDYIEVDEESVQSFLVIGWVKDISELPPINQGNS